MNGSFRRYLEEAIGSVNALVAFSAFDSPASVSVRLNPFKKGCALTGRPVPWSRYGLLLDERPQFTLDPMFHAGTYYVQDSSSMFVGHVFRNVLENSERPASRPLRVLDLCAAPGGKTTDLAASLRESCGDSFMLVANEVMKARVGVLADNVALWGDPNVVVTSDDPGSFASLAGFFDIIVADVPCSGEGMFRKDEQARQQWSEDNVALCEARQRRIIADVWPALRPGGVLIYSTCTFNRFENDSNVEWISRTLGADILSDGNAPGIGEGIIPTAHGYSLVPGHVEGEGQYCAALRKAAGGAVEDFALRASGNVRQTSGEAPLPKEAEKLFDREVVLRKKSETVTAVPAVIADQLPAVERNLHVIAAGCAAGTLKGKVLVPDADLALSLMFRREAFPYADLSLHDALYYLHRDAITLPDSPMGYVTVGYCGVPLGFVKNLGNRCNNLHPQSRRIRMNIPKDI